MKYRMNIYWDGEIVATSSSEWGMDALLDVGTWLGMYLTVGRDKYLMGASHTTERKIEVKIDSSHSPIHILKIAPEKITEIRENSVVLRVVIHYEEDRLVGIQRVK